MILVTGGTGLVGSYLLKKLSATGESIRAIKRANSPLSLVEHLDHIEWVEADLLDIMALTKAFDGVKKVYHSAAFISFNPKDRQQMLAVNVEGTANIVNLCLAHQVEKLIHFSSIAALGRTEEQSHINEESSWQNSPLNSQYAISKFKGECEVWRGIEEGLQAAILNPSVIMGSGYWHVGSNKFFQKVNNGLSLYPKGASGFVDVRDVAEIAIQLMNSSIHTERFIINGANLNYQSFLSLVAEALGKKAPTRAASTLLAEIAWRMDWLRSKIIGGNPLLTKETARNSSHSFQYDNQKIKKALGFEFRRIEETIQETAAQFLSSKAQHQTFDLLAF